MVTYWSSYIKPTVTVQTHAVQRTQFNLKRRDTKINIARTQLTFLAPNIDNHNRFHTSDAFQVSIKFLRCHLVTSLLTTSLLTGITYSRRWAQKPMARTNYVALASPSIAIKHFGDFKNHNSCISGYSPRSQTTPFFNILETLCRSRAHARSRYACELENLPRYIQILQLPINTITTPR